MSELLPCPFCGCDCIDEYEGDFGNGVYCMQCGVMMGEPIHLDFRSPRVSFEQAMTAWNTRTEREEIVHCRDCCCMHRVDGRCVCTRWQFATTPDGFCAWGERRSA